MTVGCPSMSSAALSPNDLQRLNSSPPSATYMRQWMRSVLVQIMACRLCGTKPLSKPMLSYCQLDPNEQTSVTFSIKIQNLLFTKMHLKTPSAKWRPFCSGGDGFLHYWPFVRGINQWFPSQMASSGELWYFLWCQPQQTGKQTVEMLVIWDMRHHNTHVTSLW